ncbi:sulfatase family protein [Microbacterium karelineae]|uniref:sulfatase family protein n=1 Tax=Microbacterium karelineae TaxID=2654283 RepID=UPI0012E9A1BE|nr:sulfatase [Microbacterium karelineae]
MATSPNIVWISTHDINPHLGAYEGLWPDADQPSTPRLDALAQEGVRFDQAFAAAPVCAPARSAIMTGCYPISIGTMHMRTKAVPPDDVHLVSESFREAGYYATNNWFTDFQVETPPTAFDECSPTAHWRDRPEGAPFFASFHSLITHESRIYGDDAYAAETAALPDDERVDPDQASFPPYHPDTEPFRRAWARYYDLITAMDAWVGRILDELEADGLTESTLVVFWSDHGASFPRAKRWANEAGLRVPLIARWPGRIPAGATREEVVMTMDLAPTMLASAGLEVPAHMHGTPLFTSEGHALPAAPYAFGARDRMDAQEDAVRTVRDERYRYTLNLHPDRSGMQYNHYPDHLDTWGELRRLVHEEGQRLSLGEVPAILTDLQRSIVAVPRPEEELFDLREDPHETTNLVTDPAYRDVRDRLRAALDAWRAEHGDLGTMPERDLLERWRPGGDPRHTAVPEVAVADGVLTATCATAGASIGWTTDPPADERERTVIEEQSGSPRQDGRRWRLVAGPFAPPAGSSIWVGAWRLGHAPSPEVRLEITEAVR